MGKMAQIRNETGKDFSLDKVEGTVNLTKTIEIPHLVLSKYTDWLK